MSDDAEVRTEQAAEIERLRADVELRDSYIRDLHAQMDEMKRALAAGEASRRELEDAALQYLESYGTEKDPRLIVYARDRLREVVKP
jgi:SMC interacting uncharacterized protein involved in chromosome segregation